MNAHPSSLSDATASKADGADAEFDSWHAAMEVGASKAMNPFEAPSSADAADAQRWRWLVAQHNTINPIAQVVWMRNSKPNGQWVNLIDGGDLTRHVDAARGLTAPKTEAK